jgi:hypothetical protein
VLSRVEVAGAIVRPLAWEHIFTPLAMPDSG